METGKVTFWYDAGIKKVQEKTAGTLLTFGTEEGDISRTTSSGGFRDMLYLNSVSSVTFKMNLDRYKEVLLKLKIRVNGVSNAQLKVNDELLEELRYSGMPGVKEFTYEITSALKIGENSIKLKSISGNLRIHEVAVETGDALFPRPFEIDGIEVTQAIQDMDHSVPLIEHKKTYVRVYLTPGDLRGAESASADTLKLTGTLEVTRGRHHVHAVEAENKPLYSVIKAQDTQLKKRTKIEHSLNFILPDDCTTGDVTVALKNLSVVDGSGGSTKAWHGKDTQQVKFVTSPPLRLRVIGLAFKKTDNKSIAPRQIDYDLIKSWLTRACPVSEVVFSKIVAPAGSLAGERYLRGRKAMMLVAALRNLDMANTSIDRRTHYYGVAYDESVWVDVDSSERENYQNLTFLGGMAAEVTTAKADPTTVAYGSAGTPTGKYSGGSKDDQLTSISDAEGYRLDPDQSYGDWYAGHELGHTLGRKHVRATGGEDGTDASYPYTSGKIGSAAKPFVGFDVGDSDLSLDPKALPFDSWYDVMSYQKPQWLSDYTYKAIRDRLKEEDNIKQDGRYGNSCAYKFREGDYINVVGFARGSTCEIKYVNPVSGAFVSNPDATGTVKLRVTFAKDGRDDRTVDTIIRKRGDYIDSSIKVSPRTDESVKSIKYMEGNSVKATYTVPKNATSVESVTVTDGTDGMKTISWTIDNGSSATGVAPVFNVQVSRDGGRHWETVAVGLTEKQVSIHTDPFDELSKTKVRIMATNGITAVYSIPTALDTAAS